MEVRPRRGLLLPRTSSRPTERGIKKSGVPTDKGESSAEEKPSFCKYGTQRSVVVQGVFDQGPVGSYGHLGKAGVPLLPQWKRPV